MTKVNKRGSFVLAELYQSKAFWALGRTAPQLLMAFLDKRQFSKSKQRRDSGKYVCMNSDDITMTYSELKKYGLTTPRTVRALDELLAKGFIEIRHAGGAYRQDKSIYALSEKWQSWTPGTVFSERPKDVRRGFQGQGRGAVKKKNTQATWMSNHKKSAG